jgi:hypothetical protein
VDDAKLRLHHRAGVEAYAALNGRGLALLYRASQLFGVTVRWAVYRAAASVRPNDYRRAEAVRYRTLIGAYLRPSD